MVDASGIQLSIEHLVMGTRSRRPCKPEVRSCAADIDIGISTDHILWGRIETSSAGSVSRESSVDDRTTRRSLAQKALRLQDSGSSRASDDACSISSDKPLRLRPFGLDIKFEANADIVEDVSDAEFESMADSVDVLHRLEKFLDEQETPEQWGESRARQLLISKGIHADRIIEFVPVNTYGRASSIGSMRHHAQCCTVVCPFVRTAKGCANGIYCAFCHLPHGKRKKIKDGKSKRYRYRNLREDLMKQVEADPDDFDLSAETLPEWIVKDEWLKNKLANRLHLYREHIRNATAKQSALHINQ